jgi:outer membrane receptor protein involved in Fe transport
VTGWVRNLLDEDQTTSISNSSFRVQDLGRYQTFSFAPPRTYGVDFIFRY